jgi:hypothetical protein
MEPAQGTHLATLDWLGNARERVILKEIRSDARIRQAPEPHGAEPLKGMKVATCAKDSQKDNPPIDRSAARFLPFLSKIKSSRITTPIGGRVPVRGPAIRSTLAHPWG